MNEIHVRIPHSYMIKISRQVDYAFQLILELSKLEKNALLSLKRFSNKSNISFLFLQKIAKSLREAVIIRSVKGKNGGYRLVKPADKISIKEVIEAIEGPYGIVECTKKGGSCEKEDHCSVKKGIAKLNKQVIKYFEKLKVTDMA